MILIFGDLLTFHGSFFKGMFMVLNFCVKHNYLNYVFKIKDILVFCVDVGLGMQMSPPDQQSHLQKAIEILSTLIQQKVSKKLIYAWE